MKKNKILITFLVCSISTPTLFPQDRGRGRGKGDERPAPSRGRGGSSIDRSRPVQAISRAPERRVPKPAARPTRRVQPQPATRPTRAKIEREAPTRQRISRPERPDRGQPSRAPERRAPEPTRPTRGRIEREETTRRRISRPESPDRRRVREESARPERPSRRRTPEREQLSEREKRRQRIKDAREGKDRGEQRRQQRPGEQLTQTQKQEILSKPAVQEVNRFATTKIQQNPQLKTEIQSAKRTWETNKRVRNRWHKDWSRYSWYHNHNSFYFDSFINFVFFAPWYVFPFTFYPNFYRYNYPIYWAHRGWLRYPIYWEYGLALEIGFVDYIYEEKYYDAIARLEDRIIYLEQRVDQLETEVYQKQLNEVLWLLDDLSRTIKDQSQLSRREKSEILNRIEEIKDKAPALRR